MRVAVDTVIHDGAPVIDQVQVLVVTTVNRPDELPTGADTLAGVTE